MEVVISSSLLSNYQFTIQDKYKAYKDYNYIYLVAGSFIRMDRLKYLVTDVTAVVAALAFRGK